MYVRWILLGDPLPADFMQASKVVLLKGLRLHSALQEAELSPFTLERLWNKWKIWHPD